MSSSPSSRRRSPLSVAMRACRTIILIGILASSRLLGTQDVHDRIQITSSTAEAISLFGKPLFPPPLSQQVRAQLEEELAVARQNYEDDSSNVENVIWLGRRSAYLWKYRDAIAIFSRGIEMHPEEARLYRHRGHRFITIREFDQAIQDLEKASRLMEGKEDAIEPDGQPNRLNIPTSTVKFNIWYHLGLAYYLNGNYESALRAYWQCLAYSWTNDDRLCATSDWLYMTLRRLGREEEASNILEPIHGSMHIIENVSYHRRLLMYKGQLPPDSLLHLRNASDTDIATQGYGVANWFLYNGNIEKAKNLMERIHAGSGWNAFGYIAAEADLKRLRSQTESEDP